MNAKREEVRTPYLLDTQVENIFLNEYLAPAPGDYVKVYLLCLMYTDMGQDIDNETLAKYLNLQEEDILQAWTYWEGQGVIRKHRQNPEDKFNYRVEFLSLRERLYGEKKKNGHNPSEQTADRAMTDKDMKNLYHSVERIAARPLSGPEMIEILSWVNDFHAKPEVIIYAYGYCKTKNKTNHRYVAAVIKGWVSQGLEDVAAVEEHLQETDQRRYLYKRVCKALGFARNATEEEERIMDTWFTDMEYTIDKVLEACGKTSGIANPNINYVNKVLTNWYQEKTGKTPDGKIKPASIAAVNKYYDHIRQEAEEEAQKRKQEAYAAIPKLQEIENQLSDARKKISRLIITESINKEYQVSQLQKTVGSLTQEQEVLLTDNDFERDYLHIKYKCDICRDTGINDKGERCQCFPARTKEAQLWKTNSK